MARRRFRVLMPKVRPRKVLWKVLFKRCVCYVPLILKKEEPRTTLLSRSLGPVQHGSWYLSKYGVHSSLQRAAHIMQELSRHILRPAEAVRMMDLSKVARTVPSTSTSLQSR